MASVVLGCFAVALTAQEKSVTNSPALASSDKTDTGDTKRFDRKSWDPETDFPLPATADKSVAYDYPIVYVRVTRPYPKEYFQINHLNQAGLHQTNSPGAELRLLHPDGRDESLVPVEPHESITDPAVSFDGQWGAILKGRSLGACCTI